MESALHAASLIGSPKMIPVPAASAATAPMRRRVRLWGSSSSVERFRRVGPGDDSGGKKDSATSLRVLSSIWASLTSYLRYLYMLSICWVTGMCHSLNVMLLHPACSTRYCMRAGGFWLLSRRMACTPSMLTSGSVGKGEKSGIWLSLSEITTWYLKVKAAPRSKSGSCCLFIVEYCMVFAMKNVPQMYSSVVILKGDLRFFDGKFFVFLKEIY